jgi:hypothetical protein
MKATEEEFKMIAEFTASEGVDEGTNVYMSDDEIIDFAKQYHAKQLILHVVMFSSLLKDIEKCAKTYEKMYKDGVKTLDTYSYVGIFRNLIDKHKPK